MKINKNPEQISEKSGNDKRIWLTRIFEDLCNATSLHGYSHILRKDYSKLEKLVWILVVLLASVTAIILLCISFSWKYETPTVIYMETPHYPIYYIDFPAVTICNLNKISKKNAYEIARNMTLPKDVSVTDMVQMFKYILYFERYANEATDADYNKLHEILVNNSLEMRQIYWQLVPTCQDMIQRCFWKGTPWRCDELFQPVNTSEGLCCSFNFYARRFTNYK